MKNSNAVIWKETKYIAICVLIFSLLTEAIFLIIGKWDYTVLLGNILSGFVAILNFFLMGITIQKVVQSNEKSAQSKMKASQSIRTFMIFAFVAVGCIAPYFNTVTVLIPLFFPRIAISIKPIFSGRR